MENLLSICIGDGSEIIVKSLDDISFMDVIPYADISYNAMTWEKDRFYQLLNSLKEFNFICIQRHDETDILEYRTHSFAYKTKHFSKNEPLYLNAATITTIIALNK